MPAKTQILEDLSHHFQQIASLHMKQLFADDPLRFNRFSLEAAGLLLDYSKNRITEKTLPGLISFAEQCNLRAQIEDLFSGKAINNTENRPALHTALRDFGQQTLKVGDTNITFAVQQSLNTLTDWVEQIRNFHWLGYAKKPITDIVHIGVGGSHLGPLMVTESLAANHIPPFCHFVASVDPVELDTLLEKLHPQTTLFIIASKTFTTQETLATANRAKAWLLRFADTKDISRHFIAATAHPQNAIAFGIAPELILPFWDWVGGRFSVWSAAIGLPVAIKIGMPAFKAFLMGAYKMDQHFRTAPLATNMPVILALLSFWYTHFFKTTAHAVLPYDYRLRSLPRYLQQLEMESNGKQVTKDGQPVQGLTAPVLFGEIGTNGQHSFHQLLFQGTHLIPCDFIASVHGSSTSSESHRILFSHCLAQSRGLMMGKTQAECYEELLQQGHIPQSAEQLAPHKAIPGNQPSNTFLIQRLTPETLGALMTLYEHKAFVEGVLWQINSFDQWGVELGKKIAQEILSNLVHDESNEAYDASTRGLLHYAKQKTE